MNTTVKNFLHFPVITIIAGITFCLGTMVLVKIYISQPLLYSIINDKIIADTIKNCIGIVVLLSCYYLFSKYYENKTAEELSVKYLFKEMPAGIALGFGAISITIIILYALGYYKIISVSMANYSTKLFTLLFLAALIEDLLIRGLIVRLLEKWLGTYITLIIAMLFETMHMFNNNANALSFLCDLTWGFTMALFFIYTKRIWLPFFFHLGWNFAQPFYGSNLTGLNNMGSIIHAEFKGPVLFTGAAVGVENSIFTMIILLLIGIILFYRTKKESKFLKRKKYRADKRKTVQSNPN